MRLLLLGIWAEMTKRRTLDIDDWDRNLLSVVIVLAVAICTVAGAANCATAEQTGVHSATVVAAWLLFPATALAVAVSAYLSCALLYAAWCLLRAAPGAARDTVRGLQQSGAEYVEAKREAGQLAITDDAPQGALSVEGER